MNAKPPSEHALLSEISELRTRLKEAQDALRGRPNFEEALQASDERYRTLFDTLIEGFCVVEVIFDAANHPLDYRFLDVNPAFEGQTGMHNSRGRLMREIAPDHEAHWFEIYGKIALTGEPARFVHEARALNRWFDVHAYRLGGSESRKVAILFIDITERKNAEAELAIAAKRKDEFLAMLSHELRNPLTAIRNAVEIAKDARADGDARKWAREVVDRQSIQLSRIVDDLLDVARINRGHVELRRTDLDLRSVLDRAIAVARPWMQQKRHTFSTEIGQGTYRVHGDAARLEQIFVNLLNNAAKYTPRGGRIGLVVKRKNARAIVSVTDNGLGIAPDLLPRIFDLFTQGSTSLDRAEGGLGIGLTVVKSLTELHGGMITAESLGTSAGATFTVRLPLLAGRQNHPGEIQESPRPISLPSALRILIVDDHIDAAKTLARLLNRRNAEVHIEHDGPHGFNAALQFHPDVLLLDIGLPGYSGYELARSLRAQSDLKAALFIAVSGYAAESDRAEALDAGFDHHLAKPVDFNSLLSLIQAKCTR